MGEGHDVEIEIRQIEHNSPEFDAEVRLRDEVLRKPLGLKYMAEDLAAEAANIHFAAYSGDEMVGTLQLLHSADSEMKMRQVAISPRHQGKGIGKALVRVAEEFARTHSYRTIRLNARDTAVAFYLSLNYELIGDPFIEVTIPHRSMQKYLSR